MPQVGAAPSTDHGSWAFGLGVLSTGCFVTALIGRFDDTFFKLLIWAFVLAGGAAVVFGVLALAEVAPGRAALVRSFVGFALGTLVLAVAAFWIVLLALDIRSISNSSTLLRQMSAHQQTCISAKEADGLSFINAAEACDGVPCQTTGTGDSTTTWCNAYRVTSKTHDRWYVGLGVGAVWTGAVGAIWLVVRERFVHS